jgi:hypothetical protein
MGDNPDLMSYEDFTEWHTANGADQVNDDLMRRAYAVYADLVKEQGKEAADDLICGHDVWES